MSPMWHFGCCFSLHYNFDYLLLIFRVAYEALLILCDAYEALALSIPRLLPCKNNSAVLSLL
jgi:hypothetical protein